MDVENVLTVTFVPQSLPLPSRILENNGKNIRKMLNVIMELSFIIL